MVNAYPSDNSASSPAQTMIVNGNGFRAENLTIGNYLNIDLEYPLDPAQNRKRYSDIITPVSYTHLPVNLVFFVIIMATTRAISSFKGTDAKA